MKELNKAGSLKDCKEEDLLGITDPTLASDEKKERLLRAAASVSPKQLLYPQLQINSKLRSERQLLLIQVRLVLCIAKIF